MSLPLLFVLVLASAAAAALSIALRAHSRLGTCDGERGCKRPARSALLILHFVKRHERTANQAVIGSIALLAVTTGPWWLLALLGLQLAIGLLFGRRFCLACLLYFELLQPRLGEGPLEDSRPPRFANMVGLAFLLVASGCHAAGLATAGTVLGGTVAALALLAALTGFCAGCTAYRIGYILTGRQFVSCPLPQQRSPA